MELLLGTTDGSPLDSNRLLNIEVRATNRLDAPISTWPKLSSPLVLTTNGLARFTTTVNPAEAFQFYRAVEQP